MCNLLNMYIKLIIGTELGLCNIYKGNISKRRVCILLSDFDYCVYFNVLPFMFLIVFNFQVKDNDVYIFYTFYKLLDKYAINIIFVLTV